MSTEIRAKAKAVWQDLVLNYSDTAGMLGTNQVNKKLKALNKIIDDMPIEDVLSEMAENEAFISSFSKASTDA